MSVSEALTHQLLADCDAVWRVGATTFNGESEPTERGLRLSGVVPPDGDIGRVTAELRRDGELCASFDMGASGGPGDTLVFEVTTGA